MQTACDGSSGGGAAGGWTPFFLSSARLEMNELILEEVSEVVDKRLRGRGGGCDAPEHLALRRPERAQDHAENGVSQRLTGCRPKGVGG